MEIENGFKQTEVGVIPNDWEVRKLGSILKVVGGGAFRSTDSSSTGVKWLKISNVGINQAIWDDESYLPIELIKNNENFLLKENDYVLALTRPILDRKLKITRLKKDDVPALLNQRVGKIETAKSNSIQFAYYLFQKFETINALIQSMAGTDPPNLGNWGIYNVNCAIPPTLQEQTAIATALSDTDTLISSLEKLIAKKRNIKQGAMQELLKPKKGWEVKRLGDIASLKARIGWQGLTTSEYRTSGDYFLITGTEFKKGLIDWGKCFYVDEERFIQDKNIQIKQHDVLVTKDGTIGKIALIKSLPKPATLNSGVFVIRPINESFNPEFFYYLLLSDVFIKFLGQLTAGSTINHLYQKDFVTFKFSVPKTISEQQSIAKILLDMDEEITSLESKLEKYHQVKSGMMQNLLTGKIRLV